MKTHERVNWWCLAAAEANNLNVSAFVRSLNFILGDHTKDTKAHQEYEESGLDNIGCSGGRRQQGSPLVLGVLVSVDQTKQLTKPTERNGKDD